MKKAITAGLVALATVSAGVPAFAWEHVGTETPTSHTINYHGQQNKRVFEDSEGNTYVRFCKVDGPFGICLHHVERQVNI